MTLPKKATRAIEVDGRTYRWMVRRCRGPVGVRPHLRLTVEDSETKDLFQKDFPEHSGTTKNDYGETVDVPLVVSAAKVKEFIRELNKPGRPS